MTEFEARRQKFEDQYADLFGIGISLLGADSELPMEKIRVLRAFLAQGYYVFAEKYALAGKTSIADWMNGQSLLYGVNAGRGKNG
ncbi:hypothetical protein AGMMS50268_18120 [Spirochaetia bacterium]|nr:hypothetical protein AGMMS50268_18120 [Spirochaetia bacterium]